MTTEDKENHVNLELLSNIASEAKYQEEGKQDSIKLNRKRYTMEEDEILKSIYRANKTGARTEAADALKRSVDSISARYRHLTNPHESRKTKGKYKSLYNPGPGGRKTKRRPLKKKRNTRLRGGHELDSGFEYVVNEEFKEIIGSMGRNVILDENNVLYLMSQPEFNINIKGDYGYTALLAASKYGYANFAWLLINRNADIDIRDNIGTTALIFASDNGHTEIVKMLLNFGAQVNLRNDIWAQTALHRASHSGHIEIVALLLARGANVNLLDGFESTALTWANSEGHTEISEMLTAKINGNETIKEIENKTFNMPSLRTLAARGLSTDQALSVNNLNIRSPSKLGGKKRRTRKRI